MPYTAHYEESKHRYVINYFREITSEEIIDSSMEFMSSPYCTDGIDYLSILNPDSSLGNIDLQTMLEKFIPIMKENEKSVRKIHKIAWVGDDLSAPLFSLWKSLPQVEDFTISEYFTSLSEADKWFSQKL
ncbi:hypothetical protein [Kiloniella sp. b19]|uniref:hypothetical protein n=1 Tax=Kiloniella sp. GXU_MW_B19 TaxID=3141326 RepID=UPI0031E18ED0